MIANIIHNPSRTDRWELIAKEIETQNITARMWPAIHHANPRTGISQAHKQIVRFAKQSKLKEIFICEDDVKFTAPGAFEFMMANKPAEYDIYLGGYLIGVPDKNNVVKKFAGTHCWMIHARFYDTILSLPEHLNIDTAVQKKGLFIVCNPMAAIVHNTYSDRLKSEFDHSIYFRDKKLFEK